MKNSLIFSLCTAALLLGGKQALAQTTWGGNQIFEGNVNIGTSGTHGNLAITGSTGNAASPGLSVTGDGGVVFSGSFGVGQIPVTGNGTRFIWYPKKAAFRVGTGNWADSNIGNHSVAFSLSQAAGDYSVALCEGTADGDHSVAICASSQGTQSLAVDNSLAVGDESVALIGSESDGFQSMAVGESYSQADFSTALSGAHTLPGADVSVALSGGSTSGAYSTAISCGIAEGEKSTAMNAGDAWGDYSLSSGNGSIAVSYNCVAFGRYNVITGTESATSWVGTDPLFVIGNGTGDPGDAPEVQNRNAVTVYKNGTVEMNGDVKMNKRQGDIPMGVFGNPE